MTNRGDAVKLRVIISKNVRKLRKAQRLTQQQLSDLSGIDLRYISLIEKHPPNISSDFIEDLADALKVSVAELVTMAGKPGLSESADRELAQIVDAVTKFQSKFSDSSVTKSTKKPRKKLKS